MKKQVKRIAAFLMVMAVFTVFMTTAGAILQHYGANWNIPGSDQRSRTHTWTALETSSDLFIRTSANTVNVGAEDTYYKVAISAGGGACSQVLCNLGYLVQRDVNDSVVEGERYGTYAWRVDSTLNTDVVDGLTYIYSR